MAGDRKRIHAAVSYMPYSASAVGTPSLPLDAAVEVDAIIAMA